MEYTKIQLRCDILANWATYNPTLALGEFGYESDTKKAKIGDGITPYNDLQYCFDVNILAELYLALQNVETAIGQAETATANANQATANAVTATNQANTATSQANTATANANSKITEMEGVIETANEVIEEMGTAFENVETAIGQAETATANANQATANAVTATNQANTAITNANNATNSANQAAQNANQATANISEKISEINTAITNANNATTATNQAITNANNATANAVTATTNAINATNQAIEVVESVEDRIINLEENKADKNGYYPNMTVGWAENIVSPDATIINDDYCFRTTGGSVSIESGDAELTTIKGRTITMNSKLFQGDFPTNPNYWSNYNATNNSFSVADGVATCKKNVYNQDSNLLIYNTSVSTTKQAVLTTGHKYYFKCYIKTTAQANTIKFGQMNRSGVELGECATNISTPNWQMLSYVSNYQWHSLQPFWGIADLSTSNFANVEIKNVSVIDLTLAFGEGKEPTKEESDLIFISEFYPRQADTRENVQITGFKTTGFNQINESAIIKEYYLWGNSVTPIRGTNCWVTRYTNVIGGATYHFSHPFDPTGYTGRTPTLYIFDSAKNLISYSDRILMECDITLPQNARYIRVSAYAIQWTSKSWFNMNFKWSGYRDGEHEIYQENTIDLTPIMENFPNGLQSNGGVYDEINKDYIIKRIADDGSVLPTPTTIVNSVNMQYYANDFGTEEFIYKTDATINVPVPTTNTYIKNLRDFIRNLNTNTNQGAVFNNSLDNLLNAMNEALGVSITKSWDENKNCWNFTINN